MASPLQPANDQEKEWSVAMVNSYHQSFNSDEIC